MDAATSSAVDPAADSTEAAHAVEPEASESDFDIDIDAEDLIPGFPKRYEKAVFDDF